MLGLDEDALKLAKFGVDYARTRLERKEVSMGKRDEKLAAKERAAEKVRAKVHAERQVSLLLSLSACLCHCTGLRQFARERQRLWHCAKYGISGETQITKS